MSYFLATTKLVAGGEAEIVGEEALHMLLSRRTKRGEVVHAQGTDGKRYKTEILDIGKAKVKVKVLEEVPVPREIVIAVTIFQSVVSEKALDFIFQKATELGAAGITLFNSQNTATKLNREQFEKKQERWTKILWEAAKQSDRGKIPELKFLPSISDIPSQVADFDEILALDASGATLKSSIFNHKSISAAALIVGPEGGLTKQELDTLKQIKNAKLINLSPFTLRAETAAIAAMALTQK